MEGIEPQILNEPLNISLWRQQRVNVNTITIQQLLQMQDLKIPAVGLSVCVSVCNQNFVDELAQKITQQNLMKFYI